VGHLPRGRQEPAVDLISINAAGLALPGQDAGVRQLGEMT
jgi:hypothetical protein